MKKRVVTLFFVFLIIILGACEDDDYVTTELDEPTVEDPMLPDWERHGIHEKLSTPRADP